MSDRTVSANLVAALACWVIGAALVLVYVITEARTGHLGLLIAGVGGVLNIRGYVIRLEDRERNAFDIGRDYAHLKACDPAPRVPQQRH